MLQAVVERLAEQGHEVTVICADGGYAGGVANIEHRTPDIERRSKELYSGASVTVNSSSASQLSPNHSSPGTSAHEGQVGGPGGPALPGIHIIRLSASRFGRGSFVGKLLDYASYYFGAAWKLLLLHPRPGRIIALTTPPYLSVLARLVSKIRGVDHAHWVMDLYPDVMVAHGMLAEGSWKHRLLAAFARWGFGGSRCAAILTLGPDMAERVGRLNIEHRTSNMERRSEELCSGASATVASSSDFHPSSLNPQLTPIQWVPLWGGGSDQSSVIREETTESGIHSASQLSPNHSSPRTSAHEGQVGGPGGPALPSSDSQPSTLNPQLSPTLRAKRGWEDDELIVMYSGNMGLGHRFGEFLKVAGARVSRPAVPINGGSVNQDETIPTSPDVLSAAHRLGESGDSRPGGASASISQDQKSKSYPQLSLRQRFVFYGGGKRRVEIENFIREHPEAPVELHDYAPAAELVEHLASADVHLASLDGSWTGTMVPSKLQGIFAVGRPVIFVGSGESSIGRWILESGGGWVVPPEDTIALSTALAEARDPDIRQMRGRAASAYGRKHFSKALNAARVAEIFAR